MGGDKTGMYYSASAQLIECMILAIVAKADSYGYEISRSIKQAADIKESTLYPILKRLVNSSFLTTYEEEIQGRRRKYYHLTEEGQGQLAMLRSEWETYRSVLDAIIVEGKTYDE